MADRLIAVPAARSHIDAVVADPILKACMHNVLDGLPAADAVPVVHGRWDDECRCTACGWYGDDIYKRLALSFDYCPNCGAKMDLEVPDGKT